MGGPTYNVKAVDMLDDDKVREAFEQVFLDLPDVDDNLLGRDIDGYVVGEIQFALTMFTAGANYQRTLAQQEALIGAGTGDADEPSQV